MAGYLQLCRLVGAGHRRAAWRYLGRIWADRPDQRAHAYRGVILAYRGGRILGLPPALRTPEALVWLRGRLRTGAVPVPQSIDAVGLLLPQQWHLACARLRFQ